MISELAAGIIHGPSLLGRLAPAARTGRRDYQVIEEALRAYLGLGRLI